LNESSNLTNACQNLQTVVDTNQTIITRIRCQIILLHHIHARSGDGSEVTTTSFQEHAKLWAVLFTPETSLAAAAETEVTLYIKWEKQLNKKSRGYLLV
jgi:hypothetical protein